MCEHDGNSVNVGGNEQEAAAVISAHLTILAQSYEPGMWYIWGTLAGCLLETLGPSAYRAPALQASIPISVCVAKH
jgi:hypothetical protein